MIGKRNMKSESLRKLGRSVVEEVFHEKSFMMRKIKRAAQRAVRSKITWV